MIKSFIKKRLQNYKVPINEVDKTLPIKIANSPSVAIIGSGLAGLSAAANLSERGFDVHILEKNDYIGGKVGSWIENNERVEHGFHAFFKQYYNLRNFLDRLDLTKHLIPISDYEIKFNNGQSIGFADIEKTPILNILALRRKGLFSYKEILKNPKLSKLMALLQYDSIKTFNKFDTMTFQDFADKIKLSSEMRLVFNTFARAFFEEPDKISMAQMIKGFHFYFLSNNLGLVYDVLDDDFEYTLLEPIRTYLEERHCKISFNKHIKVIDMFDDQFHIEDQNYDYIIFATDAPATKKIILNSNALSSTHQDFMPLESAGHYAVLRIWMDEKVDTEDPFFVFTDRKEVLDSITFYHNMEKSSKKWADEHHGGIYELHAYSVPEKFEHDQNRVKSLLIEEFLDYYPELKGAKILNEVYQFRNDFASYKPYHHAFRPNIKTKIRKMYVCGDWIKMDNPTMLMEAAYTSGAIAANEILKINKTQTFPLYSVPKKGIFA